MKRDSLPEPRVYLMSEATILARIDIKTLRKAIDDGVVRVIKFSDKTQRIPRKAFDRLLDEGYFEEEASDGEE